MHQVRRITGQARVAARQFNFRAGGFKSEMVEQSDRVHDRLEFMKTIIPLAQNIEEEIDFAGRVSFHVHEQKKRQQELLALIKQEPKLFFEDPEAAARDERGDITPTKTKGNIPGGDG